MRRREILRAGALLGGCVAAPAIIRARSARPGTPYGAQVGDVAGDRAVIWSATDRPGRMRVRWSTTESMAETGGSAAVDALEDREFAAKLDLAGLPAGQRVFYEVDFLDLSDLKATSEPVRGMFPAAGREEEGR